MVLLLANVNHRLLQIYIAKHLNDLWQYNTTSKQWTWISGSNYSMQAGMYSKGGSIAGARKGATVWCHKKFWLFGGHGLDDSSIGT